MKERVQKRVGIADAEVRLPDVDRLISESLRVRGSVAVRIEPRIFDLHSGARGGYRSMRGSGFTLEIGSAPAVYKTIKLLRDVIELGVPMELARCEQGHQRVWFAAEGECAVCAERRKVAGMARAMQILVEKGRVEKDVMIGAVREAAKEQAREGEQGEKGKRG